MKVLARRMGLAHLLTAALALTATAAAAQTPDETACRKAMAKNLGRFVSTAFRDVTSCHAKRNAGKHPLSVNCNDVFSIPKGKSVRAYEKARASMLKFCPEDLAGVLAQFVRCPSPHSTLDNDDATSGIDNFSEQTSCVLNLAATLTNGAGARILGKPTLLPTRDAAKCGKAVGKALRKRIDTIAKVRRECQYDSDKASAGLGYFCSTFDDGRIAENLTDFCEAITDACGEVALEELATLGGCGQTAAQIIQCAGTISTVLGGGLVAEGYEMPATCNLGFALMRVNAGLGAKRTATRFELGYNGLGQGVDLLDGFFLATNLACDSDCIDCDITLNPIKSLPQSYCRCENDPTVHCDTVDGPDADDCGGSECQCLFGPPLPLTTDGVPVCVTNEFATVEGTADGGTGVSTTTIREKAKVHLGISELRPCPACDDDAVSNDGLRNGTCAGGSRDGLACDQNANSPDFGPLSFDCPPLVASNISGSGLQLTFALTSVDAPQIGTDLMDGGNEVYCLQCSGDPSVGCSSDAQCDSLGLGTCSVNTGPTAKANACDDGVCTASGPLSDGTCEANDPDRYCEGLTRGDGGGLLQCNDNADCDAFAPDCPGGDCGNCTLLQKRACFPDPLGAQGSDAVPGAVPAGAVYGAELVSTLCVPATGTPSIDTSVGLPGPTRLLIDFDFLGRCGLNPTLSFELPGGSNCP
jgi:hypothetical protein